jgi:hypothetical protein
MQQDNGTYIAYIILLLVDEIILGEGLWRAQGYE